MPTYIVLLRAVNLPKFNKVPMAEFRKILEGLGYKRVETYIQSGNAVFDAAGSAAKVAKSISAALETFVGAPVGIVLRTHEDLGRIIAENPYATEASADGAKVFAVFLSGEPAQDSVVGLEMPSRRGQHGVGNQRGLDRRTNIMHPDDRCAVENGRDHRGDACCFARIRRSLFASVERSERVAEE
jgi:uncharacterized protein (DUF1697 family)